MTAEHAPDPPADGRVSTGTPGLDEMLQGGLVAHRPYLVVGPSGTGKTSIALQFLLEGVRQNERVLLVTIEEPPNEIRLNHRGLGPELDSVEVFDAIPDIMRYERVPFKDIAAVRHALSFREVPLEIRRSPELSAVEVTLTGLEQMLRTEVHRRSYSRLVIDSLTALQYFCMKGFDAVAGAQAFLRFLSDLRVTTILTVESPLEDADTPERMLARGEVRLFRWELDDRTVRAVGVEKFRGSAHDVRLHPYRIGSRGIDVNLAVTISRDTRQIIEAPRPAEPWPPAPVPVPVEEASSPLDPLAEEVRDLVLIGADVAPIRTEIEAALGASTAGAVDRTRAHISRANALALGLSDSLQQRMKESAPTAAGVAEAYQRIVQRSDSARAGIPPTELPPPRVLAVQLESILSQIPRTAAEGATPTGVGVAVGGIPPGAPPAPAVPIPRTPEVREEPRAGEAEATEEAAPHGPSEAPPDGPLEQEEAASVHEEVATVSAAESDGVGGPIPRAEPPRPITPSELSEVASRVDRPEPIPPLPTATAGASDRRPPEPPSAPEASPAGPTVASLPPPRPPPPTSARPMRAWSPPTLPTGPLPRGARIAAGTAEPPAPPPPIPPPPSPRETRDRRPPLPVLPSGLGTPSSNSEPRETVRERPGPNVVPLPGSASPSRRAPGPTPLSPPVTSAPPTPKRKRKPSATPRKRVAAPVAPVAPPASGVPGVEAAPTPPLTPGPDAVVASTKPKRRPARKRKAPPVVSVRAGPIPSTEAAPSSSPSPPEPTPEPAPTPPKEGS